MAGGNTNISVGHIDSKFGISIHQLPHLVRIVENTKMNIVIFTCIRVQIFLILKCFYMLPKIFDAARNFKDLEFLDFGSGFKVP
jgi:diaminopimelate decarboxylase